MTQDELKAKIKQAAQEDWATLNLSRQNIDSLPPEIAALQSLRELRLNHNQLNRLPSEITALQNLQRLRLDNNQLSNLPPEIAALQSLKALDLTSNQLSHLPPEIAALQNLQTLRLYSNQLSSLPPEIAALQSLQTLRLDGNRLSSLPPEIAALQSLQTLRLDGNRLSSLPPEIAALQSLQHLDLEGNQLSSLPPEIATLQSLQTLDLRRNQLSSLPPKMLPLAEAMEKNIGNKTHAWLGLHLENNLLDIPPEILEKHKQPTEIIRYYLQTQAHQRPLNEAKMLIVGQGAVGKTSLLKRLIDDEFDEQESKTEGINIESWSLTVKKKQTEQTVTLHIWDFGGQEIMHATHQFFLTKRSLYLVLIDARQGASEGRLEYWLKLIHSFGGDSPVIVVINKIDAQPLDVNQRFLQDKYPAIRGFVSISCKANRHLDTLLQLIHDCVADMPHVFDPFPAAWFAVKRQLANLEQDYISYEDYQRRCSKQQVTDQRDQKILIGFLHDLGIALNFLDDPRLQELSVLNPEWVTTDIYQLLNSHKLFHAQGILRLQDMQEILDRPLRDRERRSRGRVARDKASFWTVAPAMRRVLVRIAGVAKTQCISRIVMGKGSTVAAQCEGDWVIPDVSGHQNSVSRPLNKF